MRVIRTIKIAATVAAVLLLAGCILEPQDDSGSISFAVSAPEASISGSSITIEGDAINPDGADVTHARVWMYTNGSEYRLAPTSARAPSSRNYVETELGAGGATVTIDGIPAGRGYSAVIIMGTKEGDVFVPVAYARTGRFAINAGLETELAPRKIALVGDDRSLLDTAQFRLIGKNLNSVVVSGSEVISADRQSVYRGSSLEATGTGSFGAINRLSTGTLSGESVFFVNSSNGIYKAGDGTRGEITPSIDPNITDVTFSGTFEADGSSDDVVFYQREGGLGGVADATISSTSEWEDFGPDDLEDLIDPDSSPVRAQASGSGKGFFATAALDSFRVTEALFDSETEIEADELISGSAKGVQFFNVPYPGTSRPMRINHMEIVNVNDTEYLVVGTPRGAFTFPQDSIGGGSDVFNSTTNVVNGSHSSFRSLIRDEPVVALATDRGGNWLAVATAETIVVLPVGNGIPTSRNQALFILPRRGVALGEVTGLALQANPTRVRLHISGTQGLTSVQKNR